jgi:hypothetical protein
MKPLIKLATLLAVTGMAGFTPALALANPSGQCQCQGKTSAMMQLHHGSAMGGSAEEHGTQGTMGAGIGGPRAEQNGHFNGEWLRTRQEHLKKTMAKLKAMESNLDQKLADMNQATGREKVSDMSAVLNELVHQRDEIVNHIVGMQEHHLARLERFHERFGQNAIGGTGEENGQSSHQTHGSGSSFNQHNQKEPSQK